MSLVDFEYCSNVLWSCFSRNSISIDVNASLKLIFRTRWFYISIPASWTSGILSDSDTHLQLEFFVLALVSMFVRSGPVVFTVFTGFILMSSGPYGTCPRLQGVCSLLYWHVVESWASEWPQLQDRDGEITMGWGKFEGDNFLEKEGLLMICLPFFFLCFLDRCLLCSLSGISFSNTLHPLRIQAQKGRGNSTDFSSYSGIGSINPIGYWIVMAWKSLGFLEDCNTQQTPIVAYVCVK